ncbi:SigE-dependent sporulation protein [Bacillus sp. FJAT-27225]|uniref:sporulation YhaL family protein n=1 Tax=Bacillus sp. FJAT-27225 TaxID=1743144 RepID=UPI00080C2A59|nr:sporulation YhaL family protein [Bacillus sp. FJAT-27225]OCA84353.1 SigE-dependent sporulation protein [Bacillus sp. FJAT-27225]
MTIPLWIYSIVLGIAISAVMAVKTGKEERKQEMELIEKEGEVYMRRLELERERRGLQSGEI